MKDIQDQIYQEMLVQSVLKERKIHLNEDVNEVSMFKMRYYLEKIKKLDDDKKIEFGKREPIEILISSYGGDVYECLGTISLIERFKEVYKYEIITTVTTKAMSCGALLLLSGSKKIIYKYATFLLHQLSSFSYGNFTQLKIGHEESVRIQKMLDDFIISNSKISRELLELKTDGKDWYISPNECIKLGIVDEII